jgi:hypothetical protein
MKTSLKETLFLIFLVIVMGSILVIVMSSIEVVIYRTWEMQHTYTVKMLDRSTITIMRENGEWVQFVDGRGE